MLQIPGPAGSDISLILLFLFEREGQNFMRKQQGFTLIELLVVIAIAAT
jgi:prepilin-type N-terminal cleavage/methylation domain-containing protein